MTDLISRDAALVLCDRYPYVEGVKDALKDLPSSDPMQDQRVAALVEALQSVLRYVPDSVVECRGDKCREPWCASCFGWDAAEEGIVVAIEAGKTARAALHLCEANTICQGQKLEEQK